MSYDNTKPYVVKRRNNCKYTYLYAVLVTVITLATAPFVIMVILLAVSNYQLRTAQNFTEAAQAITMKSQANYRKLLSNYDTLENRSYRLSTENSNLWKLVDYQQSYILGVKIGADKQQLASEEVRIRNLINQLTAR